MVLSPWQSETMDWPRGEEGVWNYGLRGWLLALDRPSSPSRDFCITLNSFPSCQESSSSGVIAAVKITQYSRFKAINQVRGMRKRRDFL